MAELRARSVTCRDAQPDLGGSRWREAWRWPEVAPSEPGGVTWAKDEPQSNNGMQRSADTQALIYGEGAARPLMPGVRPLYGVTGILKCLQAGYSQQKTVAISVRGVV